MHAEPTLMFAALRRPAQNHQDPLEDRCTEMLATLIERHEVVGNAVLGLLTEIGVGTSGALQAETQFTISNDGPAQGQRPDLVLYLDEAPRVWVEVKVDAGETGSQVSDYQAHLEAEGSTCTLSTLSKQGASAFPSAQGLILHNGGRHVRWSELATELLQCADLGSFVKRSSLVNRDLDQLQLDVAQFLVYLNEVGVVNMIEPVSREELELVARADWFGPLQHVIDLFRSATTAAAREAGFDEGWRAESFPTKWELSGGAWEDVDGNYHLWVCSKRTRRTDDARANNGDPFPTVEFALSGSGNLFEEKNNRPGIIWGFHLRDKGQRKIAESDPAVAAGDSVAAEVGEFIPRYEDDGWRYHAMVPLADVLDVANQQEALTEILVPKLTKLREAIEKHFPARP